MHLLCTEVDLYIYVYTDMCIHICTDVYKCMYLCIDTSIHNSHKRKNLKRWSSAPCKSKYQLIISGARSTGAPVPP